MKRSIESLKKDKRFGNQICYVLDCIHSDDNHLTSDEEKVSYFFDCFASEFDFAYNKKRFENKQERIAQYLMGLPSCCSVSFMNYEILEIARSWGYVLNEKKENQFLNNWWRVLAFRLIQLEESVN